MRSVLCVVLLLAVVVGCGGGGGGGGGPAAPSDPTALYYVPNADPHGPVAGLLQGSEGNRLYVLAQRDASGNATRVTGARFVEWSGAEWTVFVGTDGMPSHLVADGYVLRFSGYTSNSLDVQIESPSGGTEFLSRLDADPSMLSKLRAHAATGVVGSHKFAGTNELVSGDAGPAPLSWSGFLGAASYVLSAASCAASFGAAAAVSAGTGFIGTVAGGAILAWGCAGFVMSTVNLFVQSEELAAATTVVSAANCQFTPNLLGCAGALASVGGQIASDAEKAGLQAYVDDLFVGTWYLSGFTVRYPDGRVFTESDFATWDGTFVVGQDRSLRQCVHANGQGGCATGTWDYRDGTFYFTDGFCGERPLDLKFFDRCMTTQTRSGDCGLDATEEDRWCRSPPGLMAPSAGESDAGTWPIGGLVVVSVAK